MRRQVWPGITAVAPALTGGALFVLELDYQEFSVGRLSLAVAVGLLVVAVGLVASADGEDRIGVLVVLAGAGWLVEPCCGRSPKGSRPPPGPC